ncbi:MAG: VOC family protein [Hyphomicrobiaceae bacterium]
MIDHVSVPVRDLLASAAFYERLLAPLGLTRVVERPATVGFGKKYPEFWLNLRANMPPIPADTGVHVCLRAPSEEAVRAFHTLALEHGGSSDGEPRPRQGEMTAYYGAFIKDPDGNKIEAITFGKP